MPPSPGPRQATARTTCVGCEYFVVRHDPRWPYGCDHFGLRTRQAPALAVLRASGVECQAFAERSPPRTRTTR